MLFDFDLAGDPFLAVHDPARFSVTPFIGGKRHHADTYARLHPVKDGRERSHVSFDAFGAQPRLSRRDRELVLEKLGARAAELEETVDVCYAAWSTWGADANYRFGPLGAGLMTVFEQIARDRFRAASAQRAVAAARAAAQAAAKEPEDPDDVLENVRGALEIDELFVMPMFTDGRTITVVIVLDDTAPWPYFDVDRGDDADGLLNAEMALCKAIWVAESTFEAAPGLARVDSLFVYLDLEQERLTPYLFAPLWRNKFARIDRSNHGSPLKIFTERNTEMALTPNRMLAPIRISSPHVADIVRTVAAAFRVHAWS